MSILQSLDLYYNRLVARGEAELPGHSIEKISFAVILSPAGEPVNISDLRQQRGKKLQPRLLAVPVAGKRGYNILPNLLWDKTAYVLGCTISDGHRTAREHAAFKARHRELLARTQDIGLLALRRFLEAWTPNRFDAQPFTRDMLDTNLVFHLEGDPLFIHQRDAARQLVETQSTGYGPRAFCLVSGIEAPVRRLHPTIKGIEGAQPSGASLISFNHNAFTSYGKEQGNNAPTSEAAAFRYGAALNHMLRPGSSNRLTRPIGDTSVVFWADAVEVGEEAAKIADDWFGRTFGPLVADTKPNNLEHKFQNTPTLQVPAQSLFVGKVHRNLDPQFPKDARFHVMGLSPNAARLSVRFWISSRLDSIAQRMAEHHFDFLIEPSPWGADLPDVGRLLRRIAAAQEKFDTIPHLLAGELIRAILAGTSYPRTLLTTALMRLRAGADPATGWHAAAIRAVLAREQRLKHQREGPPVSFNRDYANPAYQLGRMFALAEIAQRMALGKTSTTIRERYFGAATAAPANIFPLVLRGMQAHLVKLRAQNRGSWIEAEIERIAAHLSPSLPRTLRMEDQGRFVIGYYHQRRASAVGKPAAETAEEMLEEKDERHDA
jgi:CRISPR-associated protein Csd1